MRNSEEQFRKEPRKDLRRKISMAYKLSSGISTCPDIIEIADFWEVECLKKVDHSVSVVGLSKILGIMEDVQETEANADELLLESILQDTVTEIQRRIKSCSGNYPYKLDKRQNILSIDNTINEYYTWIYHYLLIATRNNMKVNRIKDELDGALIFEKLSKYVLTNYLGEKSVGVVFGTAEGGGFFEKLSYLIKKLKEGVLHPRNRDITYTPQDDKLDVVAWIPFEDNQSSKIICFGQCKTGTNWKGTVTQLRVSNFLKKWFARHPGLDPIETFLITDVINHADFYHRTVGNLFFDRCRLLNYSSVIDGEDEWYSALKTWTKSVMDQFELSNNLN